MLCSYGCGKTASFTLKNGKHCCSFRPASCEKQKQVNRAGRKDQKEIYANLDQSIKDKMAWSKGKSLTPNHLIFTENSFYSNELVKQRIVKDNLLIYKCVRCGISDWFGETIVLDLDHINGNNRDNRLENLRFLCPNCHSQTDTYKGRNKNTGKIKISDDELLTAYKKCGTIRQALLSVGIAAKGGNYERLKKLIASMEKLVDSRDLNT